MNLEPLIVSSGSLVAADPAGQEKSWARLGFSMDFVDIIFLQIFNHLYLKNSLFSVAFPILNQF